MATRRPIALLSGRFKELPSGDKLPPGVSLDPKAVGVISPATSMKVLMFHTKVGMTISQITSILLGGSATPSVTFEVRYGADPSGAGTSVVTAGVTVTSTTTGLATTALDSAAIPANSFVWVVITAKSGTVPLLHVTLEF